MGLYTKEGPSSPPLPPSPQLDIIPKAIHLHSIQALSQGTAVYTPGFLSLHLQSGTAATAAGNKAFYHPGRLILKRWLSTEGLCESLVTSPTRRFSRDRTKVPRAENGTMAAKESLARLEFIPLRRNVE